MTVKKIPELPTEKGDDQGEVPEPILENPEASYDSHERDKAQLRKDMPYLRNGDLEEADRLIESGIPLSEIIEKFKRPKPEPEPKPKPKPKRKPSRDDDDLTL
jgi:hypothetical protein